MILIISTCADKLHELEFVRPIENILSNRSIKFKTIHYKKLNNLLINKSDKIIICGTSLLDNKFLENIQSFKFIKNYKKPLLGICAGMHLIGLVYGCKLKKYKQIGHFDVEFTENFLGFFGKHKIYSLHGLYADFFKLNEFNIISYLNCPQAVKHKTKEIYGILFHPEVRNKNLVEEFVSL